jgi:hypothetical protein
MRWFDDRGASLKLVAFLALTVLLTGCATHYRDATTDDPFGFFSGLWHGAIFVFSLIGIAISWILSLIDIRVLSDVAIIGRPNSGLGYYSGYVIGLVCIFRKL